MHPVNGASLDRMCQRGLHAVLWSHICTLMHRLAAEPCSTAGLLFPFRCPFGTILLTPFSMVWDWRVSRAGPMLLYWHKLLYPYYSLLPLFPFLFCLSIGWYCGAWVFGLTGCISLSPSLALLTFFNNNNNNSTSQLDYQHSRDSAKATHLYIASKTADQLTRRFRSTLQLTHKIAIACAI